MNIFIKTKKYLKNTLNLVKGCPSFGEYYIESITHRLNLIKGEILFQRYSVGGKIELAMPFINKTIEK